MAQGKEVMGQGEVAVGWGVKVGAWRVAGGEAEAEGLEVARLLAVVLTLHRGRPLQPPASILPAHLHSWRAAIESVQLAKRAEGTAAQTQLRT